MVAERTDGRSRIGKADPAAEPPRPGPGGVATGVTTGEAAAPAAGVSPRDLRVVAGQLGRPPRPMSAVVARCPHGYPAVVEMLPADGQGRPFPTLYYLTCPTVVAAVGALESAGGVRRLQRALDADEGLRGSLAEAVRETRARRAELAGDRRRVREVRAGLGAAGDDPVADATGEAARAAATGTAGEAALAAALATGVGGVADPSRLKCLHAHAAHALARPGYRLGDLMLAEAGELWCDDRRCAPFADGVPGDAGGAP